MNELEKSQQVINARGWEEICRPYVEEVFLAVAYRGEVTQHEESETWLYNPKGRRNLKRCSKINIHGKAPKSC